MQILSHTFNCSSHNYYYTAFSMHCYDISFTGWHNVYITPTITSFNNFCNITSTYSHTFSAFILVFHNINKLIHCISAVHLFPIIFLFELTSLLFMFSIQFNTLLKKCHYSIVKSRTIDIAVQNFDHLTCRSRV